MKPKSLLINYTGYPLYISSLMPDSGLAVLAGSLISAGYETKIMDFANIETASELYPKQYSKEFDAVLESVNAEIKSNKVIPEELISDLNAAEKRIKEYRSRKLESFALKISSQIKKDNIDFIGFKLFIGEGFESSIKIAEIIKQLNPGIKIFAGGPQVDLFGEHIYKVTGVFDALAIGEGEKTIIGLAKLLDGNPNIKSIPNLIYKEKNNITRTKFERIKSLETLDFPQYTTDIYPALKGNSKIKIFYIDESRGCPYSCNFCLHPIKSGRYWRTKSAQRIVQEMKNIIEQFGTNAFRFAGSNTPAFLNKKIAEEIIKNNMKIRYSSFGHVGKFEKNYFNLLKKAGCQSLFFGIESGSQFILDKAINKNVKVETIKTSLKQAKEAGLFVVTSWIIPSPFETDETKEETFNLIQDTKPNSCVFTVPIILIGTEWYKNFRKYNIEIKDKEEFINSLMSYQAKFTFPTQLWNPFPYKIGGKSFNKLTRETNLFSKRLSELGVMTEITDEVYLMSLYTDYSPTEFRDISRGYILKGDYSRLGSLVKGINKNLASL